MKCDYCNENANKGYIFPEVFEGYHFICEDCLEDFVHDYADDFISYFSNAYVCLNDDDTEFVESLFNGEEFTCDSFYEYCYDNMDELVAAVIEHYTTYCRV